MPFAKQASTARQNRDLPTDIYISLVDALFSDAKSFLIGAFAAASLALIATIRTGNIIIGVCAVAVLVVAVLRVRDMRSYIRLRPTLTTTAAIRTWELRYVVGASAHVALLGVFCLAAFALTGDPVVQLLSFSTILAYLIGVAGRNFASEALVKSQIIVASVPMAVALVFEGGLYLTIILFVLVPLFASMLLISARLRGTLLDAVISARDMNELANRFDTALNNMPHGLAMFDADRRLLVANKRLAELLRVPAEATAKGATVSDLLNNFVHPGAAGAAGPDRFASEFAERLSGKSGGDFVVDTPDQRTLSLTFHAMKNGGSVVLVEDITDRRNAEARIKQLARYDALTGLPNRTFFRDQMDATLSATQGRWESLAVLFIDLDQFKQVNDTQGHPAGDQLLCAVSDRLRAVVTASDVVARFGGDEFVVLQAAKGEAEAATLARRIVEVLAQPYEIDGQEVVIGASIGIAMAPEDGGDADQLLKNADMALYRAKSDGRSAWRFFEKDMDVKAQARRSLELDLRNAVTAGAFELHYQPLLNLQLNRFASAEALLRWRHPERGMVSPAEFIPIAEETGLIVEIGDWVLREACRECARWPGETSVAVNLSSIQFKRGVVVSAIRGALAASGLPPHRLEVEITESVLLQDDQATRIALHQLREIGVRIALDDFGTGYSSLSYLHRFPLDKVKIDRSFLQGLGKSDRTLTLLRGIARLSAELGMKVVVEGIETKEQMTLIAREGTVDEVQGFLFSRPVPAETLRPMFRLEAPRPIEKVA